MTSDSSHSSPTASTWYNKDGSLAVPIWSLEVEYAAELVVTRAVAGALDVFAALSTATSSEVDKETTTKIGISSGILGDRLAIAATCWIWQPRAHII